MGRLTESSGARRGAVAGVAGKTYPLPCAALSIGGSWYRYDAVHRFAEAGVHLARDGSGNEHQQAFTHDVFGNLQSTEGGGGRATPTSQHTNRLTVAGTSYQQDGSLVEADGRIFRYGAFGEVLCASSVFPDNPCVVREVLEARKLRRNDRLRGLRSPSRSNDDPPSRSETPKR